MTTKATTSALELPDLDADDVYRADLVFYDVDHSGPSYEGRVFVDHPDADEDTPRDADHGYAGSYTVFGHNGCYGDEGHCLPDSMFHDEFDRRLPHPLTAWTKTVIATDAIRRVVADPAVTAVTVTVVAVVPEDDVAQGTGDVLRFGSVRLLTYQDESLADGDGED